MGQSAANTKIIQSGSIFHEQIPCSKIAILVLHSAPADPTCNNLTPFGRLELLSVSTQGIWQGRRRHLSQALHERSARSEDKSTL